MSEYVVSKIKDRESGSIYIIKDNGAIRSTEKGTANGVAELDVNGKVPSGQLPSYVDDVLEFSDFDAFPVTGESGKIYVAIDTGKTYRWSGSTYAEISQSLALGETSSTAFRGDHGKEAYDHANDPDRQSAPSVSGLYKVSVTSEGHVGTVTPVQKSDITDLGIPAQDTTYSEMSGATASLDGSNGLVPGPLAGDQEKFLMGNGEWQDIGKYYRQYWNSTDHVSLELLPNGKTFIIWSSGATNGTAGSIMDSEYGAVILVSNGEYAIIHKGSSILTDVTNGVLTVESDTAIKMAVIEL